VLTDAHCHPADLIRVFPGAEAERRRLDLCCAASATDTGDFACHEALARKAEADGAPPVRCCFAVHPQLPAARPPGGFRPLLEALAAYAAGGRLAAVGETGFDLYNSAFRETEALQDELFGFHLETALNHGLPLVLHVRRAMHKVFARSRELRKIPSVVFHSYSGTLAEGEALLNRGVNAFFSFGTTILLNHREARRCCASLPADRLLLETDAPWQPLRGKDFSAWADLPSIVRAAALLRREAGVPGGEAADLEGMVAANFFRVFSNGAEI
jgi:TatD DNase family protein